VTERGLPSADGATACPFVAFEDDRDERASVPDHRHRCYAESRPAPRALAHQEAYCLSSAFPVCPTFQDWARREAARARGEAAPSGSAWAGPTAIAAAGYDAGDAAAGGAAASGAAMAAGGAGAVGGSSDPAGGSTDPGADAADIGAPAIAAAAMSAAGGDGGRDDLGLADEPDPDPVTDEDRETGEPDEPPWHPDEPVQRNPPRDWAAPPPWLASGESGRPATDAEPPPFLGRRSDPAAGLAGSAADQLAGGAPPTRRPDPHVEAWATGGAAAGAAAGSAHAAGPAPGTQPGPGAGHDVDDLGYQEGPPNRIPRRPRAYDQHLGGPNGPDWEQPRRYEAYPTIKTRVGMPQIPRVALMAGAVGLLAIALFFLPGLLNLGGSGGVTPAASPSPSAQAAESSVPTAPPAPTPQVYTIKKGDTLTKVAKAHGLTLDELLAANPSIKNPNKVSEGQQIVIPVPDASDEPAGSAPAAAASSAP
jgi:LysM domain-containing protein